MSNTKHSDSYMRNLIPFYLNLTDMSIKQLVKACPTVTGPTVYGVAGDNAVEYLDHTSYRTLYEISNALKCDIDELREIEE